MKKIRNDNFELIEKRSCNRREAASNISTNKGGPGKDELALNVSKGGCCIKTSATYEKGERIVITFNNQGSIIGKIVWKKDDTHYGIRFLTCQLS